MPQHFLTISIKELASFFLNKGFSLNHPLLLAIDCDRTIVDRNQGAHYVSQEVIHTIHKICTHPQCIPIINTGRDLSSFQPIAQQFACSPICLFLAGRALQQGDDCQAFAEATLPSLFCDAVWSSFMAGEIPFIDVKYAEGNIFFAYPDRNCDRYYGSFRPIDWFHQIKKQIHFITDLEKDKTAFKNLNILRMELPIIKQHQHALYKAILEKEIPKVRALFFDWINFQETDLIQCLPVLIHETQPFKEDLAFLRILVGNHLINKGVGIKKLLTKWDVPEANVICFGDSSGETASDSIIKKELPKATLLIMQNGDREAIAEADFLIESVDKNGVPKAIDHLLKIQHSIMSQR